MWFNGLKALLSEYSSRHVRIMADNTTAVSCINNMGSTKEHLNVLAQEIWQWATDRNLWLSAAYIPGILNDEADKLSRALHTDMEWKLDSSLLKQALNVLQTTPYIDLFASSVNAQFPSFISFVPDCKAHAVDAFTLHWGNFEPIYCLLPFSILLKVLSKIRTKPGEQWWCQTGEIKLSEPSSCV